MIDENDNKLNQYAQLVMKYNRAFNLTGVKSINEFVDTQIADVIAALDYFAPFKNNTICDIGSGCGVVGIVLSILMPDTEFILLERSKKRANFLRIATNSLSLSNRVRIQECELSAHKGDIEVATFRALGAFKEIEKDLYTSLSINANVLMFKGRLGEVINENYNKSLWDVKIHSYDFIGKQRNIVHLKKKN